MASTLECRVTHAAHAHVVVLLLDNPRQLLLNTGLYEVDHHLDAYLLVHDGEYTVIFIRSLDK